MKTKHEITLGDWRGYGPLTIPAGTRVSAVIRENRFPGELPQCFVEDFGKLFPAASMQFHDATYYGIRVNAADCEES